MKTVMNRLSSPLLEFIYEEASRQFEFRGTISIRVKGEVVLSTSIGNAAIPMSMKSGLRPKSGGGWH
jgi:hypothetical protein